MNPSKGYYSVIQYCPDPSRGEAANVGVLLFCPNLQYAKTRMDLGNDRIRSFFKIEGPDLVRVNIVKQSIADRLATEGARLKSLEDLERFIATRANQIQMTDPRPMKVFDPEEDLAELFEQLVGGRARGESTEPLKQKLAKKFQSENVQKFLLRDIQVTVPVFKRTMTVPFGYQNGCFNLIQPTSFAGRMREATERMACQFAIEGKSLFESPDKKRLTIVAEFNPEQQEERAVATDILCEYKVALYFADELGGLIKEIKDTAKLVGPASLWEDA